MSDTPRWVKVFVGVAVAIAVAAVIVIAVGGHAPRRHGGDDFLPLAVSRR